MTGVGRLAGRQGQDTIGDSSKDSVSDTSRSTAAHLQFKENGFIFFSLKHMEADDSKSHMSGTTCIISFTGGCCTPKSPCTRWLSRSSVCILQQEGSTMREQQETSLEARGMGMGLVFTEGLWSIGPGDSQKR